MIDKNGIPYHFCPGCGASTIGGGTAELDNALCIDCEPALPEPDEDLGFPDADGDMSGNF